MAGIAINTNNISKRYRIGTIEGGYKTFRDAITETITAPLRNFRKLRSLTQFREESEDSAIWAVKDVSFKVSEGEVMGIIGRNGAGKTTLLKLLSRITEPTAGFIEIQGRVSSLLEVGTGFHPELTGRENIFLNGTILGMRKRDIEKKFDEIVAFAEVEKFVDTPVKRFSTGMQVRLAFAVAAHLEPEILLVDEVLAVGDLGFQKKCLGKMKSFGEGGRTVLIVSHNMAQIVNLCNRAILLDAGELVMDGPASDVVDYYVATSGSSIGEVIWPEMDNAPGNEIGRLIAVRIFQENVNGPTAEVDISKDIIVEIEYNNLQEGVWLCSSIILKTVTGIEVLCCANAKGQSTIDDPWYERPRPIGMYKARCCIPGNLLNEGRYSVTAILAIMPSNRPVFHENEVVQFDVHDTGVMRQHYYGDWPGVVRPQLLWKTDYLGQSQM